MFKFFKPRKSQESSFSISKSRTTSRFTTFEHYWTVDHFAQCHLACDCLGSEEFTSPENPELKFWIQLHPVSKSNDLLERPNMSVFYLGCASDTVECLQLQVKLGFIGADGGKHYISDRDYKIKPACKAKKRRTIFSGRSIACGREFILRPYWFCKVLCPNVLPEGKLTIWCEVSYVVEVETKTIE